MWGFFSFDEDINCLAICKNSWTASIQTVVTENVTENVRGFSIELFAQLVLQVKYKHFVEKSLELLGLCQAMHFSSIQLSELCLKLRYLYTDEYIFCRKLRTAVAGKFCCSLV